MVKGYWSLLLILLILLPSIEAQAYLSIPPTKAFSMLNGTGGNVTANSYADFAEFVAGSGIIIAYNYALHEIMFNASSSNSLASIHSIGNVTESGCGVGQYLSVNSTGFFVCTTLSGSGEANTMSSPTHANSLVLAKSVFDLPIKGIACGGIITCTSNTTDVTLTGTGDGVGVNSLNFTTSGDFDFSFGGNGSSLVLDSTVFEFRLKNNVVLTNESAQTITKSLTLNAGVLGGQFNIAGNTFLNTGVLTFPTLAGTILNNIAVSNTANTTSIIADNSTLAGRTVFKTLSPGTDIQLTNDANNIVISSTGGSDTTVVSNISNVNATIIADNSTSTNNVRLKGISAGTGIQIDNGTNSVIIKSTITQGFTNIANTNTVNTTSVISSNSTPSAVFKTLSPGTKIQLTNDANNIVISSTDTTTGATSLAANTTSSLVGTAHTLLWTIPLTANSGNSISGVIDAVSNTVGVAPQFGSNTTTGNGYGTCLWETPITATTTALDLLYVNSSNIVILGDTAETVHFFPGRLMMYPIPVRFDCSIVTNGTASLQIYFQAEAAATVTAKMGSGYWKTP